MYKNGIQVVEFFYFTKKTYRMDAICSQGVKLRCPYGIIVPWNLQEFLFCKRYCNLN